MLYRRLLVFLLLTHSVLTQADESTNYLDLSITTDRTAAVLNEQILLTLTIRKHVKAFGMTGTDPHIRGANIVSLFKREFQEQIQDEQYHVTERLFAIYAEKAGELILDPIRYQAQMPLAFRSTEVLDEASSNPTVTASTDQLLLQISAPAASKAVWLPASSLTLTLSWDQSQESSVISAAAGEPVMFRLNSQISGQHPSAIPPIQFNSTDRLRFYPSPPTWESTTSPAGISGSLVQEISVIGSSAGEHILPPAEIHWWDINRKEWQVATTATQTIRISPPAPEHFDTGVLAPTKRRWILFFSAVILLAAALYYTIKYLRRDQQSALRQSCPSEATAWRKIKRAIRRRDPAQLNTALQQWSRHIWPDLPKQTVLPELRRHNHGLADVMAMLNEQLYSKADTRSLAWQSTLETLKTIRRTEKLRQVSASKALLPDLYPQTIGSATAKSLNARTGQG